MALILPPKRWGWEKPPAGAQINWGDPLAAGLVSAMLFADQGGQNLLDSASRKLATTTGSPSPLWTPSRPPLGNSLGFIGADLQGVNLGTPTELTSISTVITVMVGFMMNAADVTANNNNNPVIAAQDIDTTGTRHFSWALDVNGGNQLRWYLNGSSVLTSATMVGGVPQIAAGTFNSISGLMALYQNGIQRATTAGPVAIPANTATPITYGWRQWSPSVYMGNSGNAGFWGGQIGFAYIWARELKPADIRDLYVEPYRLFLPQAPSSRHFWVPATSSSITVNAARGNGRAFGRPATVTATTPVAGARGFGRSFARPATITTGVVLNAARGTGRGVGRPAGVTGSASVTGARGQGRATGRPATITTGVVVLVARGFGRAFGRPGVVSGSAAVTGARGQGRAAGRPVSIFTGITITAARGQGRAAGRPGSAGGGKVVFGARAVGRATGRHASISTGATIHAARGFGRGVGAGATVTVPAPAGGAPAAYGIPAYGVPPYAGGAPGGAGPSLFDVTATASVVVTSRASAFQIHPPPEPVPGPFGLHDYEVIVVDKYGIAQGQIVSAVPTQIDWVLNDLGQALIDFYILDPSALLLPLAVLPGAREIQIWRDQTLIWWGWPTSVTYDAKQVHLTCSGLLFPYSKRSFGPITTNYLLNADFELPATLNVIPDWTAINCVANVTPANAVASPLLNSFMAQLQQPVPGEDAYIRQYVNVTDGGPGGGEGTFYDLSAWVYIDPTATFAPAFGQNGIFIQFIELLTVVAGPEIQQITVDTGAGQWVRLECGVEVPPNASGVLEIRLYAPQGVTYWDACRLTVQESVGSSIAGDDVQFIMEQIVTYAQDATRAKSDLAMPFAGPATGTVLERVYQFSDNSGILDALNEFPTIGVCDFEVTWDVTGHFRQFQIFPPAKGEVKYNYPITIDIPSTTDLEGGIDGTLVATTSRVLGQGSTGSSQDLGWAAFPSALGGRVALDGIFTQGSNIIQSATIGFTVDDIGEGVYCQTAGVLPIGSTIDSIVDSNTATFTSNQGGGALLNANAVLGIGGIVLDDVESALPDLPIGTLQGTAEGIVLRQSQAQFLPTARQRADGPNGLFGNVSTGDVVPVMFNYGWLTYGPVLMRVATLSLYPPTEELEVQLNVVPIGENAYG